MNDSVAGLTAPKYFEHARGPRNSSYAVNLTYDRHMAYIRHTYLLLEKWFPLQGERGHSSDFRCFQKQYREEGETE